MTSVCIRRSDQLTKGATPLCGCESCVQAREYFTEKQPREFWPRFQFDFNCPEPHAVIHLGERVILWDEDVEEAARITEIRFDGEVVILRMEYLEPEGERP